MAEKKFFVDINLQGSALTNATVGTNSSMTKAGSFRYNEGRLEYFNGTLLQEVANLRDIEAVTGGLIFQGGYDPTTDTPDITNGDAYKGFFWVATAAGTFLGESVQVGDSIVAKVDAAGATIADWLILQGNIVIATDSVDGISRLATQTEANTGTEGGAVVITPATLQGKIDAQITPEISNKLPLAGGTMSGGINMDGNSISYAVLSNVSLGNVFNAGNNIIANLGTPTDPDDAANKTYVDDNTSNKLPLAGGTMSGNLNMGNNTIDDVNNIRINAAPTDGKDATNKSYVDDQDALKLSLTGGTMSGDIEMGGNNINGVSSFNANDINTDYLVAKTQSVIRLSNNLDADSTTTIVNLPAPLNTGDATNKTYVDGAASTAQANAEATASADATAKADAAEAAANAYTDTGLATKLDLAGGTMSGEINMGGSNIANVSNIAGKNGDRLILSTGATIEGGNLNANSNKITNVPAPTDNGDAANKEYVDTTAATAESNANDYTDTEIAAQSFSALFSSENWVASGSQYIAVITHNFGTYSYSVFYSLNGLACDFYYEMGPDTIIFVSNIIPESELRVCLALITPPVV